MNTNKGHMVHPRKRIILGILAHVDAGKTTLSEAMLYTSGSLRELGRVDKGNAFLDNHSLERLRGITIFSKQAQLEYEQLEITLLDTPGHVDFSAEMERTLQILDYAILVISALDGIQAHTQTLWRLLNKYKIPVYLFVNKMDQIGAERETLMRHLKKELSGNCVEFGSIGNEPLWEEIALCEEKALDEYLETGTISKAHIATYIQGRMVFPCFFGSALKLEGVEELIRGLQYYTKEPTYPREFAARVYKIGRDEQGNRLTFLKVTGGELKVRGTIPTLEEKVHQIRLYSGEKYHIVPEIGAGSVCAVTGLNKTKAGMNLGSENAVTLPILEPVLTYRIMWPKEIDVLTMLSKFRMLEEEEPQLQVIWKEELQELQARLMGTIQLEVIVALVQERFGIAIEFGEGNIVYKETIQNTVEGIGHYEPLKHYAEVHLLLTPGEPGSGLQLESQLSEDELDRNWQRLILTHLREREHRGVLTGSFITDIKVTLVAGRAHQKHTEGGDFRQAVYRALRQGLKQAESVLLEPWYTFRMELPQEHVGRAMMDIERMKGTFQLAQTQKGQAILSGEVPVFTLQNYQKELTAYTKGYGMLFVSVKGYQPCHNTAEILEKIAYDFEKDIEYPADSIFCAHGAGFVVKWDAVWNYMHIPLVLTPTKNWKEQKKSPDIPISSSTRQWIGTEEIDAILEKTSFANAGNKTIPYKKNNAKRELSYQWKEPKINSSKALEQYLLVDGYNIVFAWEELRELAKVSIDGAKARLLDLLCNYQSLTRVNLIVVFDAYRVENHREELFDYYNIHVVYTAQAETADCYIERFAYHHKGTYHITVATSDYMEQMITRGQGCSVLSARELEEEAKRVNEEALKKYV